MTELFHGHKVMYVWSVLLSMGGSTMWSHLIIDIHHYRLSNKVVDPVDEMNPCSQAKTSPVASFLMHQMLTVIRHAVSHPAIIMGDSMPCGRRACPDIKVPTWISSTAAVLGLGIDHINDSKGKVSYKQATKCQ